MLPDPAIPDPSPQPPAPTAPPDPDFLCALVKTGFNLEAAVAQLNLSGTELLEFARAPDLRDYLNDIQGLYTATLELQKLSALSTALATLKERSSESNDDQVERRRAAAAITTFSRPTRGSNSNDDTNPTDDDQNDDDPNDDPDNDPDDSNNDQDNSSSFSPSASSATSAFVPSSDSPPATDSTPGSGSGSGSNSGSGSALASGPGFKSEISNFKFPIPSPAPPTTFRQGCDRRLGRYSGGPFPPQRRPDDLDTLPLPTLGMTHEQVIAKCLGALQHNDEPFPDAGIKTIFNFASDDEHIELGFPHYEDFAAVFKHGIQAHLVNLDSYVIPPQRTYAAHFGPECWIRFFHVLVTKAGVEVDFEIGVCSIDNHPGPLHLAILGAPFATRPLRPP